MNRIMHLLFGTWPQTRATLIVTGLLLVVIFPAMLGWLTQRVLMAVLGAVMPFAPLILLLAIIVMVLRGMVGSLFGGGQRRRRR